MDDVGPAPASATLVEHPLTSSVLVLNRHYTAIRVVSAKRAFTLLCKGYAEAIDATDESFNVYDFPSWMSWSRERRKSPAELDVFVMTPRQAILVPRILRLVSYDKVPKREIKFNRRNILARDENRCQYCGKRLPASQLSIDHVTPKSRGGKSTWTNVVAACNPCNTRKGGRLPGEAAMPLRKPPAVPRRNPALADKVRSKSYRAWRLFLGEGEMAIEA